MNRLVLFFVILMLVTACEGGTKNERGFIHGRVTLGPVEPVCQASEGCKDAVYVGARVVVRRVDGSIVGRAQSDEQGMFRVQVPSGEFRVSIDVSAALPSCPDAIVSVQSGRTVETLISCDSGIR